MSLPELLRQGCACCAPCRKVDEMFEERSLEMVNVTMVTKISTYPEC
jgi:hypothetical protein